MSVDNVPVIVELGEYPCSVKTTSSYWYITFCNSKDLEPTEEFISKVPSSNLFSIYSEWIVPTLAVK